MRRSVWKWFGLGAVVMLLLIYFIELTSSGLQRMNTASYTGSDYETTILKQQDEILSAVNITENNAIANSTFQKKGKNELERELEKLENELLSLKKKALEQEKQQLNQLLLSDARSQSNVNKLADTTSGALQTISSSGMQFIAELFHKVIN